jgi:hypothetical protein
MISAVVYLIDAIIVGLFCYKAYSISYGNKSDNRFATYIFWATLFIAISFLKSAILIPISINSNQPLLLFWTDFAGRALFYAAAAFSVQIPLYKFFPKSNKTIILSFVTIFIGATLLVYQLGTKNFPFVTDTGIVNWNSGVILTAGMAILLLLPWAITSFLFIKEFIKSKFRSLKPFLIGSGFFLICVGATFQDSASTILLYILFSIPLVAGFMFVLAGMFYEEEQ